MKTICTPQLEASTRKQYAQDIAALPDLSSAEQGIVADICVAHWKNNEGTGPTEAGIKGIANLVRSQRAARQEQIDALLKGAL